MAYRKFKGIEYPVPGVDTAINTLRPDAIRDGYAGGSGIVIIAYPTS
jgi:hypothetical protein